MGGQTALEMGLVNRSVEQNLTGDAAYREALSLAREILPQVRAQTLSFLLELTFYWITPTPSPSLPVPYFLFRLFSSWSPTLSRPPSLCISFTPFQMPTVGRARMAVKW